MRSPKALPLMAIPSRNWALVHTDATVVNSLIVTLAGGFLPSTATNAIAGLSPPFTFGRFSALGDKVEAAFCACVTEVQCKPAIITGLSLRQLLGRISACQP